MFIKTDNTTTAAATIIDAEADLTSMNADGFTLNWTKNDAVADRRSCIWLWRR